MKNNVIRYRIGIIDDFKNEYAFVDYRDYGGIQIWDACRVASAHRGYHLQEDSIHVFLNLNKVGEYHTRHEAEGVIKKLLLDAPIDLKEFWDYLL